MAQLHVFTPDLHPYKAVVFSLGSKAILGKEALRFLGGLKADQRSIVSLLDVKMQL